MATGHSAGRQDQAGRHLPDPGRARPRIGLRFDGDGAAAVLDVGAASVRANLGSGAPERGAYLPEVLEPRRLVRHIW